MRIVEKRWTHLAEGYKTICTLEEKLRSEWKHAVKVAQEQKHKREISLWKRKQAVVILVMVLFVLVCGGLCAAAYYYQDLKCLFAFWMVIVGLIAAVLGVAMWGKIRAAFTRPTADVQSPVPLDITSLWWGSLAPKEYAVVKQGDKGEIDFLGSLFEALPDTYLAVRGLLTSAQKISDTDVLLLGPSGIWVFEVKFWAGVIHRQAGTWRQVKPIRGKWGKLSYEEIKHEHGPDEQWLNQKEEISKTISMRMSSESWVSKLIQGGVVFTHPAALLKQENIQGHTAPFGAPKGWIKRIKQAEPVKDFTVGVQLQLLDALIEYADLHEREVVEVISAQAEAERIYNETAKKLREYVASWV